VDILAKEVRKLRLLLEELLETLEVMGDRELMEILKAGEEDVKEGQLIGFNELLKELALDEQEV